MAEINDIAFRELCKKTGASLCYTGMINPLTQQKLQLEDKPAIQLFCTSESGIAEFMKKYDKTARLWDFNLGCPAKNARKLGFGSFMCHNLQEIDKILKVIRESTDKPVTVKLRKSRNINKIIKIAEKYCDAICIHPRTQEQGYSGKADVEYALKLKKRTKLPVIYSGDVDENNFKKLEKKFDFLMIGRAAVGNPGIFSRLSINKQSERISFKDYLELAIKHKLYFSQIKLQAMNFTKGLKTGKEMRRKLILAKTTREIREIYSI
ncbi:MAG: tRNA-dihydrouridine synthase family protein [Nanoarchaeota archaeon]|nr:tRNA-dihydrouridine synthase family protein [Nanoarchaeota archaeon]MBU4086215.1 tRNA-dihydrouridine synthase family protein [Nanoarchaeota archaeon]